MFLKNLFSSGCAGSLLLLGLYPVTESRGYSPVVVHGLILEVASLAVELGFQSKGSVVVVQGLRCPRACGIFLD